ncbi:hypothetical protein [Nitrososphaera sp.]|uniref:hypothetical protein n=1 Tax=Nitrososphaera sp. TaxID=1971748 RepID=UPI00317F581D
MVEASEIKAEADVLLEKGAPTKRTLFERAVALDRLPATMGDPVKGVRIFGTPVHRIRKGVKIHVPSDYYAVLYTENARGMSRIHGIFEYSEPEAPHKIDDLPELPTKGIIRKSYDVKIVYIKNDREDFGINIPDYTYSTRQEGLSAILTTDLLPIHYRVFRLEIQITDPNAFITRIIAERIEPSYRAIRNWIVQELYWIVSNELTKYDLLSAIKEKMQIQKEVHDRLVQKLAGLSLELLSFVWDYDIQDSIRDRYFWLHVQKILPTEVLKMETLVNMSRELSHSPQSVSGGSQTILSEPLRQGATTK